MNITLSYSCTYRVHSLLPCYIQKQEETQSSSPVSTADVENETIISLVTEAVTSIFTRLQSKSESKQRTTLTYIICMSSLCSSVSKSVHIWLQHRALCIWINPRLLIFLQKWLPCVTCLHLKCRYLWVVRFRLSPIDLAEFEDGSSKVSTLISEAGSVKNISRMDPAWNPWL